MSKGQLQYRISEIEKKLNNKEKEAETVREHRLQRNALEKFIEYDSKRARLAKYVSQKNLKKPAMGLLQDSANYRAKVESRMLCDLGCTIEEKYGP